MTVPDTCVLTGVHRQANYPQAERYFGGQPEPTEGSAPCGNAWYVFAALSEKKS